MFHSKTPNILPAERAKCGLGQVLLAPEFDTSLACSPIGCGLVSHNTAEGNLQRASFHSS